MNEQRERERFQRAIDRTMGGVTGDPFLHTRVMAAATQKKEGVNLMKYKHLITMAVAVALCLTVAVASELFNGTVDWDGNLTPDAPQPTVSPTMVPEAAKEEIDRGKLQVDFERANEPAEGQQAVYYDLTQRDTPNAWTSLFRSAANMEEFGDMMALGEGFTAPASIPDGYQFSKGLVYYGCKPESSFRLVNAVNSGDGFRAEFYELDEEDAIITGYTLEFLKQTEASDPDKPETWARISVYAFLSLGMEEAEIYVRNSLEVFPVSIPHMTKAVAIQETDRNSLEMYSDLAQPISCRNCNFDDLRDVWSYPQVKFSVWSDATMAETIALFGGK